MKLLVALGNPGKQYRHTRHNAGWIVMDALFPDVAWSEDKKLGGMSAREGEWILLKPHTYMNRSGESVRTAMDYYKLSPSDVVVMHDEIALPLGEIKVSKGKSAGGHNGVASLIQYLKTNEFTRIRIGVAPTNLRSKLQRTFGTLSDYVLGNLSEHDRGVLERDVAVRVREELEKN